MVKVVDKKSNLARGFADVHTPSVVEKELLYTWREKRLELKDHVATLRLRIAREGDRKKANVLKNELSGVMNSLTALTGKVNKRINIDRLRLDRLNEMIPHNMWDKAMRLADMDKAAIESSYSIDE